MSLVRMQTKNKNRRNSHMNVGDGVEYPIDGNGICSVPPEVALLLVGLAEDWTDSVVEGLYSGVGTKESTQRLGGPLDFCRALLTDKDLRERSKSFRAFPIFQAWALQHGFRIDTEESLKEASKAVDAEEAAKIPPPVVTPAPVAPTAPVAPVARVTGPPPELTASKPSGRFPNGTGGDVADGDAGDLAADIAAAEAADALAALSGSEAVSSVVEDKGEVVVDDAELDLDDASDGLPLAKKKAIKRGSK